jgi:hypothetical protein
MANDPPLPPIEGGSTSDEPPKPVRVMGQFDVERHRGTITIALIAVLALIIVGHYVCVFVFEWNGKKVEGLNSAFTTSLPVISGLVGSAVAYYFTQQTKK